jgi:hypothetical protein
MMIGSDDCGDESESSEEMELSGNAIKNAIKFTAGDGTKTKEQLERLDKLNQLRNNN